MKNFYEILGVPPASTLPEIKKAYRELSKKYHPDLNPGNVAFEEKFKSLQEAYAVLKDPYKRRIFDERLEAKRRESRTFHAVHPNNLRPVHPPFSNRDPKTQFGTRKKKRRKLEKKDLYFAGGVILFLITVVTTIFILESRYYDQESNFDSIDTSYDQPFVDSLNLIRGYTPDTAKTTKK